jgi:hypothetical protein
LKGSSSGRGVRVERRGGVVAGQNLGGGVGRDHHGAGPGPGLGQVALLGQGGEVDLARETAKGDDRFLTLVATELGGDGQGPGDHGVHVVDLLERLGGIGLDRRDDVEDRHTVGQDGALDRRGVRLDRVETGIDVGHGGVDLGGDGDRTGVAEGRDAGEDRGDDGEDHGGDDPAEMTGRRGRGGGGLIAGRLGLIAGRLGLLNGHRGQGRVEGLGVTLGVRRGLADPGGEVSLDRPGPVGGRVTSREAGDHGLEVLGVLIRVRLLGWSLSHEICHEVRGEGLAHGRLLL